MDTGTTTRKESAMSKTDFEEAADLTALSGLYAGLIVGASDPGTANLETATGLTEASYASYARLACALGSNTGTGAGATTRANTAALTFAPVAGAGITVHRVGFYGAATAGSLRYYNDVDLNTAVAIGVNPYFAIGALTVGED
jgi:hypothetical protein